MIFQIFKKRLPKDDIINVIALLNLKKVIAVSTLIKKRSPQKESIALIIPHCP